MYVSMSPLATGETDERNGSAKGRDGSTSDEKIRLQTGLPLVGEREAGEGRHLDEGKAKREREAMSQGRRTRGAAEAGAGELSELEKS